MSSARFDLCVSAIALLFLCASCRGADAAKEPPPEREARQLLSAAIRIDTSNPPGNETPAAALFRDFFAKSGIEAQLIGADPSRQSVYARLSSGSSQPALLLLNHLDVVPANASEWTVPPFSGVEKGGYIWGRGALDIKSFGVAQAIALVDLKRRNVALERDVIFLGVADEEAGGLLGVAALLSSHPELFADVGFVLNEGGSNDTVVDRITYWGIEVDQKIPVWLELTSRGTAEHAATPPEDGGSSARLVTALSAVHAMRYPYEVRPSVEQYFEGLAPAKPGPRGEAMADIHRAMRAPDFQHVLSPGYRSLLRNTVAITRLRAGDVVNSMPSVASAQLDARLLPGSDPDAFIRNITAAVGKNVEVKVLVKGLPTQPSPVDNEFYRLLSAILKEKEPESVVGPLVSPGTSDSRFFRARGVAAYGLSPFKVNYYDADSVHGVDERIKTKFFDEGVRLTREIVHRFATK